MIAIQLENGDYLDVPPEVALSLTLENPFISDDDRISPGSYTLPFQLPGGDASPSNAQKLNNPDVLESNQQFAIRKAKLFFDGVMMKQGTLKSYEANGNTIQSNFVFGLSQISPEIKTANLRDIVSEVRTISNNPVLKRIFIQRASGNYNIKVNGVDYGGTASGVETAINLAASDHLDTGRWVPYCVRHNSGMSPLGYIDGTSVNFLEIKLVQYNTVGGTPTFQDAIDPLLPLHVVPNDEFSNYACEAFDMDPYYADFDTFFDDYMTGDYPADDFRIPMMLNGLKFGDDDEVVISESVNHQSSDTTFFRNEPNEANITAGVETFTVINRNSIVPVALLKWVLDKIADHFGFTWDGDFYTDSVTPALLIDNTFALDDAQYFIGRNKFVFWKREFNMSDLVPDVKVVEFLSNIQSRYNIGILPDATGKKVSLYYRENVALGSDQEDITGFSSPVQKIIDQRITGFNMIVSQDDDDKTSVKEMITVGTPEVDISVDCGRLHQMQFHFFNNIGRELVRKEHRFGEKFKTRLFHYRGIVTTAPFDHPWAHIDTPTPSMELSALYESRWKYWLHFRRNRRLVQMVVNFPFRMLINFDWKKIRVFGGKKMMVKSISVQIKHEECTVTQTELLTMS